MEDVRSEYQQFKTDWEAIYESLKGDPKVVSAHLGSLTLDQLNEVVGVLSDWFTKTRSPVGFTPVFHLARNLASLSVSSAKTASQAIKAGQYTHFPTLISSLNQILPALHTMLAYSGRDGIQTVEDMAIRLSEGIQLVNTAQSELSKKKELLEQSQEIANQIANDKDEVEKLKASILADADGAKTTREALEKNSREIETVFKKSLEHGKSTEATLQSAKDTMAMLEKGKKELNDLQDKCAELNERIESLLPSAASAGLASSFALRVKRLQFGKWVWAGIFLISVGGLLYIARHFFDVTATQTTTPLTLEQIALQLLLRLPITAPLVWMGWFSAVQYLNTVRLQEDYAFKEATSIAFEGYRKYAEHIAAVNSPDGNNALSLLTLETIAILAKDPLRIFQKVEEDASPASGILQRFFPTREKTNASSSNGKQH